MKKFHSKCHLQVVPWFGLQWRLWENSKGFWGFDLDELNILSVKHLYTCFIIPNIPLINLQYIHLEVGWIYNSPLDLDADLCAQTISLTTPLTGCHPTNKLCWQPSVGPETCQGSLTSPRISSCKDPWMVLGDNFPDFSNTKTIFYEFNTIDMNFIQNKQVKLDETRLDAQGHFKAHLSNLIDVWPPKSTKLDTLPIHDIINHLYSLKPHGSHITT